MDGPDPVLNSTEADAPLSRPPAVLVLLAAYNGSAHIAEQLRSIYRQSGVRVRVLLGDDGSTDDTIAQAVATAAACGGELSVLRHQPAMRSASQNFFALMRHADMSAFDHVALSDQDDIWMDRHLVRGIERLRQDRADFYSCNCQAFWSDRQTKNLRKDFPQKAHDHVFESASQGCTYVFTRNGALGLVDFLKCSPESLKGVQYHDWLIYAWARSSGHRWIMDEARLVRYRQSASNVIGANAGMAAAYRRLNMLRSGWLRQQVIEILHSLSLQSSPLYARISRFNLGDRVWLAAHASSFRRRPRDVLIFALMTLTIGI